MGLRIAERVRTIDEFADLIEGESNSPKHPDFLTL